MISYLRAHSPEYMTQTLKEQENAHRMSAMAIRQIHTHRSSRHGSRRDGGVGGGGALDGRAPTGSLWAPFWTCFSIGDVADMQRLRAARARPRLGRADHGLCRGPGPDGRGPGPDGRVDETTSRGGRAAGARPLVEEDERRQSPRLCLVLGCPLRSRVSPARDRGLQLIEAGCLAESRVARPLVARHHQRRWWPASCPWGPRRFAAHVFSWTPSWPATTRPSRLVQAACCRESLPSSPSPHGPAGSPAAAASAPVSRAGPWSESPRCRANTLVLVRVP